jgi:hypothetical protein
LFSPTLKKKSWFLGKNRLVWGSYFGVMRGGKELKTLVIGSLHKETYREEVYPEQVAPLKGKGQVVDCERTIWKPIQYQVDPWVPMFKPPSAFQGQEK